MSRAKRTRTSGSVRQLPSGRWQARVFTPDGERTAVGTYRTKADADRALRVVTADIVRGGYIDPRRGRVTFESYAVSWLEHRPNLRPRTREVYDGQLRRHLLPTFGAMELAKITGSVVRAWYTEISGPGRLAQATVAKQYRLLKSIMATAVEDEMIPKNPWTIKGASIERSAERPIASIAEVDRLVELAEPRMKALILMATYTALRFGELAALTRRYVDLDKGTVSVVASASEMKDGTRIIGEPKSWAGRRTVAIPAAIIPTLTDHLDRFSEPGPDGVVFVGPKGGPLRRGNFNNTWTPLRRAAGLDGLRFHDLRHTGNTLAAMTGASTRELMSRMGHSSVRAALGYQHATVERERLIARKLSEMIAASRTVESAPA